LEIVGKTESLLWSKSKEKIMKKEIMVLALGVLISMLVVNSGCSPAPATPEVKCDLPYKIVSGKCCLDQNNNNQCDDHEQRQLPTKEACKNDADCELDVCMGCVSKAWSESEANEKFGCIVPQFPAEEYECKCVNDACAEVQKIQKTKVTAGNSIRFGEEKVPITLEMQKDTKILFITEKGDEVYTLDALQEAQITIFYGKEKFIIKKGTSQKIGPLEVVFSGINPPKGGNYAVLKIQKKEN